MRIHPFLRDPNAVLVVQVPLVAAPCPAAPPDMAQSTTPVGWDDYRRAARLAMTAMKIELEGEKVVIKPNLTSGEHFANPDSGITTHPGFIQGMIEYLQGGAGRPRRITIAEDPRNANDNAPRSWTGTGYERLAQETGARLHNPSTFACVKKEVADPLIFSRLNVSRLAVAADTVLFNVPKLKTHNLAITTLCMKNLMGLVNVFDRHFCAQAWKALPEQISLNPRPRGEWFDRSIHERWQEGLALRLVDTAKVIQPALNIVEGVVGREGTGFQRGRNRPTGLVIAGVNLVAVDSLASYLMGFDPQRLIYLQVAARAGLGENAIQKLHVYTLQAGELAPCVDVRLLRVDPPFTVLTGTRGEDPLLFRSEGSAGLDPVDRRASLNF